jgi:hypothetical protein
LIGYNRINAGNDNPEKVFLLHGCQDFEERAVQRIGEVTFTKKLSMISPGFQGFDEQ